MKTNKTATATAREIDVKDTVLAGDDKQVETIQPETVPANQHDQDTIRVRAYLISERRMNAGIEGSPESDWYEALTELTNESIGGAGGYPSPGE
jgi:hypothetical protein